MQKSGLKRAAQFAAVAGVVWLAAACSAADKGPADDVAAVEAFGDRWLAAYVAADADGMAQLYEPDAWLMTRGAPALRGREAIIEFLVGSPRPDFEPKMVFEYEDVRIDGDYAFLISKWWGEFMLPGATAPVRDAGRSFLVFRRGPEGRWRVWRDIDNHAADVDVADWPD